MHGLRKNSANCVDCEYAPRSWILAEVSAAVNFLYSSRVMADPLPLLLDAVGHPSVAWFEIHPENFLANPHAKELLVNLS